MDELTRRRLARDHQTVRDAAKDPNYAGTAVAGDLERELLRIGIPTDSDINAASMLLGLPGSMMNDRGMSLDQMKALLEIGMMLAPSEPYDVESTDCAEFITDYISTQTPGDNDDLYNIPLWVRMMRNAYCEMVFSIEDVVDADKTDIEIMHIAKNAMTFLLETFWIACNPERAS